MTLAVDAINRALEGEDWARAKLATHVGHSFRLAVGPIERVFAIDAGGRLADGGTAADLSLRISPVKLPMLLAAPERWPELVDADGDAALATTLGELAGAFPWFVERTLASFLGPIVGQQVADAGRRLLAVPGYASGRFADSVARYVGEEARLAVGSAEAKSFADEVAATAARVDALEARIDALIGVAKT